MAELQRLTSESNRSIAAEVYLQLRKAIVEGNFRPNERLVETQIADALGVSRTPVREAIHRLEEDGLVRSLPNRSTVAVWFGPEEIDHIYSIRARVEGYAARLVAARATDAVLDELDSIARRFAESDPDEQDALNRSFHKTIINACQAPLVAKMATSLVEHSLMSRLYLLHTPQDRSRSISEHYAIARALRMRDGATADRLVCEHLEWARDILLGRNR
mgnify:CR=1 FL=1